MQSDFLASCEARHCEKTILPYPYGPPLPFPLHFWSHRPILTPDKKVGDDRSQPKNAKKKTGNGWAGPDGRYFFLELEKTRFFLPISRY